MTERRESVSQGTKNRRVSLQLEISEKFNLDRQTDTHTRHEPWPQHCSKKQPQHQHHVPRKSRRQSVIAQELQAMGCLDWSTQAATTEEQPTSHASNDRLVSSILQKEDRRYSVFPTELPTERRQSTYPGVKAQLEAMQREQAEATAQLERIEQRKYSLLANSDLQLSQTEEKTSSSRERTQVRDKSADHQLVESAAGEDHQDEESVGSQNETSAFGGSHLASQASERLAQSNKLEDQINLQHLVELMRIFYVSLFIGIEISFIRLRN